MELATQHDLSFVCESNNNFGENLSMFKPEAQQFLSAIYDTLEREQYVDYFVNRQFRSTILCLKDCKPDNAIQQASIKKIYYRAGYALQDKEQDGETITELKIRNSNTPIREKATVALLRTLADSSQTSLSFDEWAAEANEKYASEFDKPVETQLMGILPLLIRRDFVKYWPHKPSAIKHVAEIPHVYKHARFWGQNKDGNGFCNYFGESLKPLPRQLSLIIDLMDGKHTRTQISEALRKAFLDGDLILSNKNIAELLKQYEEDKPVPNYSLSEKRNVVHRLTPEQLDALVEQAMKANYDLLVKMQLSVQ